MSSKTSCAKIWPVWLLLLTVLGACANVTEDFEPAPEVGVIAEGLSGDGESFWQPARLQMVTKVYYCFLSVPSSQVRTIISDAVNMWWSHYANIDFFDEGSCSTATHAAEAIMIRSGANGGSEVGTRARGGSMYLPYTTTDAEGLENLCGSGFSYTLCQRMIAIHEFGHALGFTHESSRDDRDGPCAFAPSEPPPEPAWVSTFVTEYDYHSITDINGCNPLSSATLSQLDIQGAIAIYGSGGPNCGTGRPCKFVSYPAGTVDPQYGLRLQRGAPPPATVRAGLGGVNALYLQPREDRSVGMQTWIGEWERWQIRRLSGTTSDGSMHYGDMVAFKDRWGHFLSGRDNGTIDESLIRGDWERWIVESPDTNTYRNGDRVLINGPIRLRSVSFGTRLTMTSSGALMLSSATGSSTEWRLNGPMYKL